RAPQSPRPWSRTSQRPPPLINRKGKIRIDEDIAIAVVGAGPLHTHHLVPAVHAGNWVGMHRKCKVLMHASIAPPDSLRIGIGRFVVLHSRSLAHLPLPLADLLQIDPGARHAFELIFFIETPASHMVRAGHHAWGPPLSDPG